MGKTVWPLAFCMALALNAAAGTEMMSEGTFIFVDAKTSSYWHTAGGSPSRANRPRPDNERLAFSLELLASTHYQLTAGEPRQLAN